MIWDGCLVTWGCAGIVPIGYAIVRDSCGPDASNVPLGVVFEFVRGSCVGHDVVVRDLRRATARSVRTFYRAGLVRISCGNRAQRERRMHVNRSGGRRSADHRRRYL